MAQSYYFFDAYGDISSVINGFAGYENHLYGEGGNDLINGAAMNDRLYGGEGNDTIYGNAGNDYIEGNAGNDTIFSGNGNDTVMGGMRDRINLGAGNDVVVVDGGTNSTIIGDSGNDLMRFTGATSGIIYGNLGADNIFIGRGMSMMQSALTVKGGADDDVIVSDTIGGVILGEDGHDVIEASLANAVNGGNGNDRIVIGSPEQRELGLFTGGAGNDLFQFYVKQQEATITDFTRGQDKIDLSYFHLSGMQDMRLLVLNGDTLVEHYDRVSNQTFELWLSSVTNVTASDFIF